jgi:hypothetical protein
MADSVPTLAPFSTEANTVAQCNSARSLQRVSATSFGIQQFQLDRYWVQVLRGPPAFCRWLMQAFIAMNAGSV